MAPRSSIVFRLDEDAHFAAGLDGEGLVDAAEAGRDALQRLEALDVGLERLHARAGTAAADRVGDLHDERLQRARRRPLRGGPRCSARRLRDAVAPGQLGAEDGVRALQLAVDRLADVVQQRAAAQRR